MLPFKLTCVLVIWKLHLAYLTKTWSAINVHSLLILFTWKGICHKDCFLTIFVSFFVVCYFSHLFWTRPEFCFLKRQHLFLHGDQIQLCFMTFLLLTKKAINCKTKPFSERLHINIFVFGCDQRVRWKNNYYFFQSWFRFSKGLNISKCLYMQPFRQVLS